MVKGKGGRARLKFTRQILFKTKVLVKILEIFVIKLIKIAIKIHKGNII